MALLWYFVLLGYWGRPGPIPRRRIPVQGEEVRGKNVLGGWVCVGEGMILSGSMAEDVRSGWDDGDDDRNECEPRDRPSARRFWATRWFPTRHKNRRQTKLWNKHPSNEIQTIQFLNTEKWPVCSVCVYMCVCVSIRTAWNESCSQECVSVCEKKSHKRK